MMIHSAETIRAWLEADDPVREQELFAQARALTRRTFGRRLALFAPLYLSNLCVNGCLYCGFRRDNPLMARRALRTGEIRAEAEALAAAGHQTVLLVAGEHPQQAGAEAIARAVAIVRGVPRVREIRAEIMPLATDGYRRLSDAGACMIVLYQETYNRARYAQAHPSGPKANYDWRLGALGRAARAGFRRVGMGILVGLHDAAEDAAALIAHARAFRAAWGVWPAIALPRIQPALGAPWAIHPPCPVTDRTFLRMLAIVRVALPRARIVLSTREGPALRDTALRLGLGVTDVSAGSRTAVGGYALGGRREGQFAIQDERPAPAVAARARAFGYELAWARGL